MKFLLCAEFFHPSVGGVQEVIKQISLGLVGLGHEVTVATTAIGRGADLRLGDVHIAEFVVSGNLVRGLTGEIDRYRRFVCEGGFDAILIYAAQQWTLDALLDDLPDIKARKVLVPCGFSGFYLPEYQDYFRRLANDFAYIDTLVFHSRSYRDYEFAAALGLRNCVLIPNGASEDEFLAPPDSSDFRERLGIASDALMLLTVGSLNGAKGHLDVAKAVSLLHTRDSVHVVLNGNAMPHAPVRSKVHMFAAWKAFSLRSAYRYVRQILWHGLSILNIRKTYSQELEDLAASINNNEYGSGRRVSIVDLPRAELIKCFFEADLFVFASKIEYSPLVLFEAAAAGLPFLTVPVGNAREIAEWTGAGRVCPAAVDSQGYTHVDTESLAAEIDRLIEDRSGRRTMGQSGRDVWREKFTWRIIVSSYEKVLMGDKIVPCFSKEESLV